MIKFLLSPGFWFQVLASTTPVMLATLAANIVSQAGMFNLGIEGTMLFCALTGVLVSAYSGSLLIGTLAGMVVGIFFSYLLGYFALYLKASMNAVGVAINLTAFGGTVFILASLTGSKITSSSLVSASFPNVHLPLIRHIPVVGDILSGHNIITYIGWFFAAGLWWLLFKSKLGVEIRAVGENEEAARSVGIPVMRTKFVALTMCGIFCAFGGMYLSMGALKSFTANMVAGRGFLSLAMDTLSGSHPLIGWAGSLLYGFSNTSTVYLQMYSQIDLKAIDAFPYIFIIVVLVLVQMLKRYQKKRKTIK